MAAAETPQREMAEDGFITRRQVVSAANRARPSRPGVPGSGLRGPFARAGACPAWSKVASWELLGCWKLLEGSTDSVKHPHGENWIQPRWKLMKCKSCPGHRQPLSAVRLPNRLPAEQGFGGSGIALEGARPVSRDLLFRQVCKRARAAGGPRAPRSGPRPSGLSPPGPLPKACGRRGPRSRDRSSRHSSPETALSGPLRVMPRNPENLRRGPAAPLWRCRAFREGPTLIAGGDGTAQSTPVVTGHAGYPDCSRRGARQHSGGSRAAESWSLFDAC